jgi:hypothetical protein
VVRTNEKIRKFQNVLLFMLQFGLQRLMAQDIYCLFRQYIRAAIIPAFLVVAAFM